MGKNALLKAQYLANANQKTAKTIIRTLTKKNSVPHFSVMPGPKSGEHKIGGAVMNSSVDVESKPRKRYFKMNQNSQNNINLQNNSQLTNGAAGTLRNDYGIDLDMSSILPAGETNEELLNTFRTTNDEDQA